jgi:hypothetical protein
LARGWILFAEHPFWSRILYHFFILPGIGIELEAFPAAVIALSNLAASFICEIVAGGILAVPSGQREAATASGLSGYQQLRYIVLPQAMRTILPPLVGQYVLLVKDSSVVSAIGVVDVNQGRLADSSARSGGPDGVRPGGDFIFYYLLSAYQFVEFPGKANDGRRLQSSNECTVALSLQIHRGASL